MTQPKVIFLDAVGTIFGIRGSVGDIYGAIAKEAGVEVSREALNTAFYQSFKASSPCAFPGVELGQIPQLEFEWWEAIAYSTFNQVGVINQFPNFRSFFHQLYHHFNTSKPWYVYPDVLPALNHWQEQGIELGIISNFDTRLYTVLEVLGLKEFFDSITISSMVGAAKPERQIFESALEKHACSPEQAWHIGDSLTEDYTGARVVGLKAFLIER